jgi:hypothetical protein
MLALGAVVAIAVPTAFYAALSSDTSTLLSTSHAVTDAPETPYWWLSDHSLLIASDGSKIAPVFRIVDRNTGSTRNMTALTNTLARHGAVRYNATISPDGKRMALIENSRTTPGIFVISLDSGEETRVWSDGPLTPASVGSVAAVWYNPGLWTGDGKHFVVISNREVAVRPHGPWGPMQEVAPVLIVCGLVPIPHAVVVPTDSRTGGFSVAAVNYPPDAPSNPCVAVTGFGKYVRDAPDSVSSALAARSARFARLVTQAAYQCNLDMNAATNTIYSSNPQGKASSAAPPEELPIALAPDMTRVAWIDQEPAPQTVVDRLLSRLVPGRLMWPNHYVAIYTATIGKSVRRKIARIPVKRGDITRYPRDLRWLPGGTMLSYTYRGKLFTVDARMTAKL